MRQALYLFSQDTLGIAEKKFELWRKNRSGRGRIPKALWQGLVWCPPIQSGVRGLDPSPTERLKPSSKDLGLSQRLSQSSSDLLTGLTQRVIR